MKSFQDEKTNPLNSDGIQTKLELELELMKVPKKEQDGTYSKEFTLKLFLLQYKYEYLLSVIINEKFFDVRVGFLRSENNDGYERVVDSEEVVKQTLIEQTTKIIWEKLNISHGDYALSFKKHAMNLTIEYHLKIAKQELDKEVWGDAPIPHELTLDKALEIKDFAKDKTNAAIQSVMNRGLDSSTFEIMAK